MQHRIRSSSPASAHGHWQAEVEADGVGGLSLLHSHTESMFNALLQPLNWLMNQTLGSSNDAGRMDDEARELHGRADTQADSHASTDNVNQRPMELYSYDENDRFVRSGIDPPSSQASPNINCGEYGRVRDATRTLRSCLTSTNDSSKAQSIEEYNIFLYGSLIHVFDAQLSPTSSIDLVLDPSIRADLTCDEVWNWLRSSEEPETPQRKFFVDAITLDGTDPSGMDAPISTQQQRLFDASDKLVRDVETDPSSIPDGFNSPLVQYAQLWDRCFARENICHLWVETKAFCICPYDRRGPHCELFRHFGCDLRLVYPMMDTQFFHDDSGVSHEVRCEQPSSFQARRPSVPPPGTRKILKRGPQTDLQRKYEYVPELDGEQPCMELPPSTEPTPSQFSTEGVERPQSSNMNSMRNPSTTQSWTDKDAPQHVDFYWAVDCTFMPDQDPIGKQDLFVKPWDDRIEQAEYTYHSVKQTPDPKTLKWLREGNWTWDEDYDQVQPPWEYEVLRYADDGRQVKFAVSSVAANPITLRSHLHNFALLSDTRFDELSAPLSAQMLQHPPNGSVGLHAALRADPEQLRESTVQFQVNFSSILGRLPQYYPGGRLYLEVGIETKLMPATDASPSTPSSMGASWIVVPQGVIWSRWPARLVIDYADYKLLPPASQERIHPLGILLLSLLGLGILAALWKCYQSNRRASFHHLVERNKLKRMERIRMEEEARMEKRRLQKMKNQRERQQRAWEMEEEDGGGSAATVSDSTATSTSIN